VKMSLVSCGCRMENSRQLGAAKSLLQTVEDLFRKQRLASAAHEYETAILAWHRQCKSPEPLPGMSLV
jgi:hypothetical protein